MELKELCIAWGQAKANEKAANAERVALEDQIVAITGKREEGSQTHEVEGGFKVTVTGKVTRKMDWKEWEKIKSGIPSELHPVKYKPELDEAGVKWLQENNADVYRQLPIETKPAKTAVDVKVVAND